MPEMRVYGVTCKGCRRIIPLGKVELPATAELADLQREVSNKGWGDHVETCLECGGVQFCTLDALIFLA